MRRKKEEEGEHSRPALWLRPDLASKPSQFPWRKEEKLIDKFLGVAASSFFSFVCAQSCEFSKQKTPLSQDQENHKHIVASATTTG